MKTVTVSKIDIQNKASANTNILTDVKNVSVGKTATYFLIPADDFKILQEKYGIVESGHSVNSKPMSNKIFVPQTYTEVPKPKKRCTNCGRRKEK